MECFNFCTECCKCCCPNGECPCYGRERKAKEKYPHIEYYEPSKAIDVSEVPEAPYHKVPIKKIFEFPQESREFRTHPQVGRQGLDPLITIAQQPTSHPDSDVEPMYISKRGRTIGTVSELPSFTDTSPSDTPEPPPFTPPYESETERPKAPFSQYVGEEPAVQFGLYYDIQRRVLTLNLLCAYNLPGKEIWGSSDFFVSMFLLPSRDKVHQSRVASGTSNPMFNQHFDFQSIISEELYEQVLVFQLFAHDKFTRDHLVGTVIVPLTEADLFGVTMVKKIGEGRELLQKFATGDLLLSLRYGLQNQVLQGIILKATNLPRPHKWGLADPYVKVYLVYKQKRMSKWKSGVKKSTLAPVFNEAFEFDITGMEPRHINIEIFVMDHDRFRKNDVIGMVYLGANVPSDLGVSHYCEVLANPQHPISHWHKLIPHHQTKGRKRRKSMTM